MNCVRINFGLTVALLLGGCANVTPARQELTTLYFGLGSDHDKAVTPAQWDAFVNGEVVPRFPGGFTVLDGQGHWQDKGVGYDEPSRILVLVHPHLADIDAKLNALRTLYAQKFGQTSVLRVDQAVRHVSF